MFVVSVLCLLACLAVVTALAADRAARGWRSELAGSATAIVRPKPNETADAAAARAAEVLPLASRASTRPPPSSATRPRPWVEPWLGKNALPDDLPLPRLVSIDLDPERPASAQAMDQALKAANIDATVDDHSFWLKEIERAGFIAQLIAVFLPPA